MVPGILPKKKKKKKERKKDCHADFCIIKYLPCLDTDLAPSVSYLTEISHPPGELDLIFLFSHEID